MNIKSMLCATAVAFTAINTAQAALIAHYDFDSSLTADQTGNGFDLNNQNVTTTTGVYGNAADFNGLNSYLWRSGMLGSLPSPTTFAISFWYRANSPAEALEPLVSERADSAGYRIQLSNDIFGPRIRATTRGPDSADTATNVARPANDTSDFQHVVFRMVSGSPGSSGQLYLNGTRVDDSFVRFSSANGFSIGADFIGNTGIVDSAGTTSYFDGAIDEVYVFDHILSEGDIHNLYTFNGIPNPGAPLLMGLGLAMLWQRRRKV